MNSFASVTADKSTQILKKESCKMHTATLKHLFYKEYFDHNETIILVKKNAFEIFWLCKLFKECQPVKTYKQHMLKKLSYKFLFCGRLTQLNEFVLFTLLF